MNLYEAIHTRRDVREFRSDPIPDAVLRRLLEAAHAAPSVGFMQPWDFVLVRSEQTRRAVHASFAAENARAAQRYPGERGELYRSLKLEGLLEAPLHVCITCDRERGGDVLGRASVRDTDLYSTCLAIQTRLLCVAYLCLGYPRALAEQPMLQTAGWRERLPLRQLVHAERFGEPAPPELFAEDER
jgi:5,6-dimethylbenzimidazole synthase